MNLSKKNLQTAKDLVQYLYDHPEIGGEEFKAQALYKQILEKAGFDYEEGLGMETDFIASYKGEADGPVIAFCAEYDALPEIGHGCGHNHFGGMSLLAALEMKEVVNQCGGEVRLYGTPGEENLGGKITGGERRLMMSMLASCSTLRPRMVRQCNASALSLEV